MASPFDHAEQSYADLVECSRGPGSRVALSLQPLRVRATPAVADGDLETADDIHVAGRPPISSG